MTDINMVDETSDGYQVIVVNIKYGKVTNRKSSKELLDTVTLDIPEGILKCKKNKEKFYDTIEQFVYNTISKKYGVEVNFCQIWLPLED